MTQTPAAVHTIPVFEGESVEHSWESCRRIASGKAPPRPNSVIVGWADILVDVDGNMIKILT